MTTSTRSIITSGMRLMSTAPSLFDGTKRRPSSRTSVRFAPKPRRFTFEAPADADLLAAVSGASFKKNVGT